MVDLGSTHKERQVDRGEEKGVKQMQTYVLILPMKKFFGRRLWMPPYLHQSLERITQHDVASPW